MLRLILFTAFLFSTATASAKKLIYFVNSVNGSDNNNGKSSNKPFKSIDKARLVIREVRDISGGVDVFLADEYYDFPEGPLTFTYLDSGHSEEFPIRYLSGSSGDDGTNPILHSGVKLDPKNFNKEEEVYNSNNLLVYDLKTSNLTVEDLGDLSSGDLKTCANLKAEAFLNGEPGVLARYPNINDATGLWEWSQISGVCEGKGDIGDEPCLHSFISKDEHFKQFVNETDLWLHGYWSFDWADNHIHISEVKASGEKHSGGITFVADVDTPPVYGFLPQARFYAENVLQELDTSDEYFLDRKKLKLYLTDRSDLLRYIKGGVYSDEPTWWG